MQEAQQNDEKFQEKDFIEGDSIEPVKALAFSMKGHPVCQLP